MKPFKSYFLYTFDFVGVASRKEFWPAFAVALALFVVSFVFLFMSLALQLVGFFISLILLIPTTSAVVRRLHDTDRSAKNLLWLLVPFIGMVIILIFLTEKTKYTLSEH